MTGRMRQPQVFSDLVYPRLYPDDNDSDDSDYDDDPASGWVRKPKPKPYVAMSFFEIQGRTKGVLNPSVAAPCSMAVSCELRKLTNAQNKNEAQLVFNHLRGNSLIVRRAEIKRDVRRKPYFWFNKRVEKNRQDNRLMKLRREKKRALRVERLLSGVKGWELNRTYDASSLRMDAVMGNEVYGDVVEGFAPVLDGNGNVDAEMRME